MTSYPFIEDLFRIVLSKSKAIQGRFYVATKNGNELFSDNLDQVITEVAQTNTGQKYPLSLMLPPLSRGNYVNAAGEWESYRITQFFLKTTFYDGSNNVINPNPSTGTSTHTLVHDWHDMKRCAINFLRVLNKVQKEKSTIHNLFRLDSGERVIQPVSYISADRASGVRLDFNVSLFIGCTIEDYEAEDISAIVIPAADTHPEHTL